VPGQLTHRESKDQQQDPAFFCVALQLQKRFLPTSQSFCNGLLTHWQRQNLIEVFCTLS